MASPGNAVDRLQATNDWAGLTVQGYVYSHWDTGAAILDVGAGWGKYRDLLPDFDNMDACEIWEPYVDAERLRERYRDVFRCDVLDLLADLVDYDVAILGDVMEHLSEVHAHLVLASCWQALVVVPFLYPQEAEEGGNPYERHVQADLTLQVMETRYPELRLEGVEVKDGQVFKGFYVKESGWEPPGTNARPE